MKVYMLFADQFKTRFMQDADMFENFKVLALPLAVATVVPRFGKKHVAAIRAKCEGSPNRLVTIFDGKKVFYRDESVKVISDGQTWCMLDDWLKQRQQES